MRAWVCRAYSDYHDIAIDTVPDPVPGKGQVLIRPRAACVTFVEMLQVQGLHQHKYPTPFIPGGECSGEVVALGEGASRFKVGDRVKVEGFDFGNSPTEISQTDVRGRTIVHTTSAGTQGLTNAAQADTVLTGSLVNAAAICSYIEFLAPERVSIVRMGLAAKERCMEDDLCAEVLRARLSGESYDVSGVREQLRAAPAATKFFDPEATWDESVLSTASNP